MNITLTNEQIEKLKNRPTCSVPGCNNLAANTAAKSKDYYPTWRRSKWIKDKFPTVSEIYCCHKCHDENIIKKHGVSSVVELTAFRAGYDNATDYKNSKHPYLQYRKKYCENNDGRLGFACITKLHTQETLNSIGLKHWRPWHFLQVDHIDGNSSNNDPNNLQTLCSDCHRIKTYTNKDHATPGRKTLKLNNLKK